MNRRQFLTGGLGAASLAMSALPSRHVAGRPADVHGGGATAATIQVQCRRPRAFSVIPVVGDGRWIWTKPPENERGYLEPRPYQLRIGIEIEARADTGPVTATTPLAVECPEQRIEREDVRAQGCQAAIRTLAEFARQLVLTTAPLVKGQKVAAWAETQWTLCKQFHGFAAEQFPARQTLPRDIRLHYLGNSPGIETSARAVRQLVRELSAGAEHPWEQAQRYADWVSRNIEPRLGAYTSVATALKQRVGDCEEMAGIFVALCRASEIPARLVWVPNHAWAEFFLVDTQGQGHWLPAHTACYFWFGWTGAHELVLQKGDRITVPERPQQERLLSDWLRWSGPRPDVRYLAELTPLAAEEGSDPGPGARRKARRGEWELLGAHSMDRYLRR